MKPRIPIPIKSTKRLRKLAKKGVCCAKCNTTEQLTVHHIYCKANSDVTEYLCVDCHSEWNKEEGLAVTRIIGAYKKLGKKWDNKLLKLWQKHRAILFPRFLANINKQRAFLAWVERGN